MTARPPIAVVLATLALGPGLAPSGAVASASSPVRVASVLCDGRVEPVGVEPGGVRFSWIMESDSRGQAQRAYEIEVATGREPLVRGVADTWPKMVVQTWRRFFKKAAKDANTGEIYTYADNGTTVRTTQSYTDDGAGNETQGAAS